MRDLTLLSLAAGLLLAACSPKDKAADPQPAPAAPMREASFNLRFDNYATAAQPAETQSFTALADQPAGQVLPNQTVVRFKTRDALGCTQDSLAFVLPRSRQKADWVGTYSLAAQPDASLGDAQVGWVRISRSNGAYSNGVATNRHRLEGSFAVTAYDPARRLISGSYSVGVRNVKNPFSFLGVGSAGDPRRDGDLLLSGTFREVPLE